MFRFLQELLARRGAGAHTRRAGSGPGAANAENARNARDARNSRNPRTGSHTQSIVESALATRPQSIPAGALDALVLSPNLEENIRVFETLAGTAPDLVVRRLVVFDGTKAAVIFYDTLGRSDLVSIEVIKPLTYDARRLSAQPPRSLPALESFIRETVINTAEIEDEQGLTQILEGIAEGKAALLLDGSATALMINLVGFNQRALEEPIGEPVVRGPREGFTENLHTNLSLIRRRVSTPLLRFETLKIGKWTKTEVAIAYLRGIAGDALVSEVRRRLELIEIDGILDSSYLEEFIEDTPYTVFPQIMNTERPDTVVAGLLEGRVAIICNGSPSALIVPTTFWSLMNASEDHYQRWDGATFVRLLRYVLVSLVVLLPSVYVAATTFHPEMLPANMLISIAAAREAVPFSSFTEVFAMELTFEALREAGVRLPRPVGQTIGIVGAIVIGEAAVQAQIVSAPVVIIVAFTGVSSFVIPHFNLGISIRIIRFPMLILAGSFGLFGISMGLMLLILHLATLRSFGVPYLSPISPFRPAELKDALVRLPLWRMFRRPHIPGGRPSWRQGFPLMPHRDRKDHGEASRNAPERS